MLVGTGQVGLVGRQGAKSTVGVFNFLNGSLRPEITYTRASTAAYFNSAGVIASAAINEARFDTYPLTLQPRGLLVEAARTNLQLNSEDLTAGSWTKIDSTITADSIVSPNGLTTADLVTEGAAGTAEVVAGATITAGATHTQSVYLKRGNHDWFRLEAVSITSANGTRAYVNLGTGTLGTVSSVGTGTAPSATIQALPNGWYRLTLTAAAATETTGKLRIMSATADGNSTRISGGTHYIWGLQGEEAGFASSYIPTTGAALTRAANNAIMAILSSIGYVQGQGTFIIEAEPMGGGALAAYQVPFSLSSGAFGNRIILEHTTAGNGAVRVNDGGITQVSGLIATPAFVVGTVRKTAIAYANADFATCANGGTVATQTSGTVPLTIDRMGIGNEYYASSTNQWFGWIRKITYYPTRLPDAQLQSLTA
jgi:hypothetical protein